MANFFQSTSVVKQEIISLRGLSHEVCVAATQPTYWQQLKENSNISITSNGIYVPSELEQFCKEDDEPRLQLIIESQYEQDNKQLDNISTRIRCDLTLFNKNDQPVYDHQNHNMIVYGSLYNSLPNNIFETERNLLGQGNCNIKRIRNTLGCSIETDKSMTHRYKFTIHHEELAIVHLALIQIQALVRQAQDQYLIAFATKIGRSLTRPIQQTTPAASLIDPNQYPSFTPFQSSNKRKREDEPKQPRTSQITVDSDESEDETRPDEKREQRREQAERLLTRICERMQDRKPMDETALAREDSSQIKSYYRSVSKSKGDTHDTDTPIELIEQEIDLRTRGLNEHKCTLVFNKLLKMGAGARDRLKKTAKIRAFEQLKTLTRDTPRENLVLKPTRDGLWKAIVKPTQNE